MRGVHLVRTNDIARIQTNANKDVFACKGEVA